MLINLQLHQVVVVAVQEPWWPMFVINLQLQQVVAVDVDEM
jgi:hypothetical protein